MEDAKGQPIGPFDLVMFKTTGGAHNGRGLAVRALPGNKLSVLCVDGAEVAKKACEVTVVDRSYLCRGTIVTSALDPSGQAGVVTGATTALDLVQLHLNAADEAEPTAVATAVSPADVRHVHEIVTGDYVVLETWLGRVVEFSVDVDVLFDDGSVCRVSRAGDKLRVAGIQVHRHRCRNIFYPGEAVTGEASAFKASRWRKGYWKPSCGKGGVVAKVKTAGVLVYWVASLQMGTDPHVVRESAPPAYQPSPQKLTFFCSGDALATSTWAVGNLCFFRRPHQHRHATARRARKHYCNRMRMGAMVDPDPDAMLAELERPMSVADVHTTVDVLWQDGTRQHGIPSVSLLRALVRTGQEFLPGQRVIVCNTAPTGQQAAEARVGVVKSLNYQEQTACVSWITSGATMATASESESSDTVVSAYDLRRSHHDFFYGYMVVRRLARSSGSDVVQLQETTAASAATTGNDLSWVGHIVDLCDAQYIQVKWGDGSTSKVLLHEIALVRPRSVADMLQEMGDWVDEDDHDNAFDNSRLQDTPQEPRPALTDNNNDDDTDSGSDAEDDGPAVHGTPVTMGRAGTARIIQSVVRIGSGMLARGKRYMASWSVASAPPSTTEPATTENIVVRTRSSMSGGHGDDYNSMEADVVLASDDAGVVDRDLIAFKHFDVTQSPQDHHYLQDKGTAGGGRKWLKRVQKEWKILENNLPDTIYVRAFEDRMDLLRAVIVGASGTPYHDGLFFFDLQLPPSFPATPPLVSYRSFGLRVNPNLYPSGTVCLSLLNTFGGKGTELWSPEASSILQVVVSIQGLVLTAQPYYNEAGYAAQVGTPEGQRNELPYCENTYLLNLRTMLHLLHRPPAGFDTFVRDHFRCHGQRIIRSCEAYMQGCLVGTLDGEGRLTDSSRERPSSTGFRLALHNVLPRLVEALVDIGAKGCEQHRTPPSTSELTTH